ncbi:hypothetical protein Hanom_Chr16g01510861 [Helianthus anomalus]
MMSSSETDGIHCISKISRNTSEGCQRYLLPAKSAHILFNRPIQQYKPFYSEYYNRLVLLI